MMAPHWFITYQPYLAMLCIRLVVKSSKLISRWFLKVIRTHFGMFWESDFAMQCMGQPFCFLGIPI